MLRNAMRGLLHRRVVGNIDSKWANMTVVIFVDAIIRLFCVAAGEDETITRGDTLDNIPAEAVLMIATLKIS